MWSTNCCLSLGVLCICFMYVCKASYDKGYSPTSGDVFYKKKKLLSISNWWRLYFRGFILFHSNDLFNAIISWDSSLKFTLVSIGNRILTINFNSFIQLGMKTDFYIKVGTSRHRNYNCFFYLSLSFFKLIKMFMTFYLCK